MILLLCGCHKTTEFKKSIIDSQKEDIPAYIDENNVTISMYADNEDGVTQKVHDIYQTSWIIKKDIVVLSTFYTDEEFVSGNYYQDIWKKYAQNYSDYSKYKTGWELKFSINGSEIHRNIKNPKDVNDFYDYLEIYLYDSVNQTPGVWYSHLLENEVNENTILTTMKLTCGSKCDEITSDIEVKVYTYDTEDDFDNNGFYRGNSYDFVKVTKE